MNFISDDLLRYCEAHSEPESPLLAELNRQTHLKVPSPRMLSGHLQGRFLAMLSKLLSPSLIVEIGTYTGYSALCLAEGLKDNGKLVTIDPNEETNAFARGFFARSEYKEKIDLREGQASAIIPQLPDNIDLVFIDADKKNYGTYFDLLIGKVRQGGLILADNTLWSGKVIAEKKDAETEAIASFNSKVKSDARVNTLLLPLRDGITLIRKT
jgi:caffeoyl-CoA O-methyltransferase